MFKNVRKWAFVALAVLLVAGLTGCKVDRLTKKINQEVGKQVDKIASGTVQADKNFTQEQSAVGLSGLKIENSVGTTKVTGSEEAKITVDAKVAIRGADSEESAKSIIDMLELVQESQDGTAVYYLAANGKKLPESLDKLKATYGSALTLSIDYSITLPHTITQYTIDNGVGDLLLSDTAVSGKLGTGVGNITLDKSVLMDDLSLNTGTGNLTLGVTQAEQAQKVTANAGVGDIQLTIPEQAAYSLEIEAFMEDGVKKDVNGGGPLFKLNTGVGNVKINGSKVK
jgi:hypothetical protein